MSFYVQKYIIPLGDFLGEMTNELDEEDHIIDFTSAGPKNYGYKTKLGKKSIAKCVGSPSTFVVVLKSTMM